MPDINFANAFPPSNVDHVAIRRTASGTYQWQWSLFTAVGGASHFRSPHLASLEDATALATAWAAEREIEVIHLLPSQGADGIGTRSDPVPSPVALA